jgi:hypothetical protein
MLVPGPVPQQLPAARSVSPAVVGVPARTLLA